MNNLIEAIWHQPEILTWKHISQRTSPKVRAAAPARSGSAEAAAAVEAAPAVAAADKVAADRKCQIVLEYIWNWNLTWWQNQ